jgi:hypothetical protein
MLDVGRSMFFFLSVSVVHTQQSDGFRPFTLE